MSYPSDWSSDGRTLLVTVGTESNTADIGLIRFDDLENPIVTAIQPLIDWPDYQLRARFSPADRWIAFVSGSSSTNAEIFVVSSSDPSRSVQISTNTGNRVVWSPTEDSLFYVNGSEGRAAERVSAISPSDPHPPHPAPAQADRSRCGE